MKRRGSAIRTYEQIAADVLARRDAYLKEREAKIKKAKKYAAASLCLLVAVIAAAGLLHTQKQANPQLPTGTTQSAAPTTGSTLPPQTESRASQTGTTLNAETTAAPSGSTTQHRTTAQAPFTREEPDTTEEPITEEEPGTVEEPVTRAEPTTGEDAAPPPLTVPSSTANYSPTTEPTDYSLENCTPPSSLAAESGTKESHGYRLPNDTRLVYISYKGATYTSAAAVPKTGSITQIDTLTLYCFNGGIVLDGDTVRNKSDTALQALVDRFTEDTPISKAHCHITAGTLIMADGRLALTQPGSGKMYPLTPTAPYDNDP